MHKYVIGNINHNHDVFGVLTLSQELCKVSPYKLFHLQNNHISSQLLLPLFDREGN